MKYIDTDKLISEIERLRNECAKSIGDSFVDGDLPKTMTSGGAAWVCEQLLSFIASLHQEQPHFADASKMDSLEYWLEHFGMPKENIDNCITQIAQGYGACRYLEGIQHGAEAVNELAKQEQPEVDLEKEEFVGVAESPLKTFPRVNDFECGSSYRH